jgi:hypothetical protein
MAGLVPAIHVFDVARPQDVDARHIGVRKRAVLWTAVSLLSSWPGLSRPSTSLLLQGRKTWMPARIGVPCTPSFRTAVAGHDAEGAVRPPRSLIQFSNSQFSNSQVLQPSLAAKSCSQVLQPSLAAKSCSQVLQPSLAAKSCSQVFQTPMRHHPYCLARPRVGPSSHCLPSKKRGMARQGAQPLFLMCPHSLSEIRGATRRATRTSLRSPGLFAAFSLLRRAALFVATVKHGTTSVSQLLAGGPYWPPGGAPAPPGCVLCEARPRAPHPIPPA